jgi:hypothetical protein
MFHEQNKHINTLIAAIMRKLRLLSKSVSQNNGIEKKIGSGVSPSCFSLYIIDFRARSATVVKLVSFSFID